jgi:hypothetical protein
LIEERTSIIAVAVGADIAGNHPVRA